MNSSKSFTGYIKVNLLLNHIINYNLNAVGFICNPGTFNICIKYFHFSAFPYLSIIDLVGALLSSGI